MSEPSDAELLANWLKQESDEAFRALTARYAGLVFMAARQTCRNETLAADAAQLTFITLARKGASLLDRDNLAGWLHRTAVLHSKNALQSQRNESRKRDEFGTLFPSNAPDSTDETWEEIEPLLSESLEALPSKDRDALLLRFYRRLSLKEVAEAQLISAAAAQKRVDRAIDRLRRQLAIRGCVAGSGLSTALAQGLGTAASASPSLIALLRHPSIALAASASAPSLLCLFLSFLTVKKALVILSALLLLSAIGTIALRGKPDVIPSIPASAANGQSLEAKPDLRPVTTDSLLSNPAADEQQRLKELYGEEPWRIASGSAEDVVACVQAIRELVEPHFSKITPEEALGSFPLGAIIAPDAIAPGKEAAAQQAAYDFIKRQWEETREALARLDRSPAPLLELLLASDACASGKMSLENYEALRNSRPDYKAVTIPVDPLTRSINFGFTTPLKDPIFVEDLKAALNQTGQARLEEPRRTEALVRASSNFDQLPPTRLESLAGQAKGARQIIEALKAAGDIK